MKLLEKLKNTFFEEEYVEVEEDEQEVVVAKKVEPKEIKKEVKKPVVEEVEKVVKEEVTINYSDTELSKKDSKVPYFEEDDFVEEEVEIKKDEPKKIYGESADKIYDSINYNSVSSNKPYGAPNKGSFQPTPIISPIYGVLDKNYRKEEVVDKRPSSSYVSRRNVDLDSVRKKAYGSNALNEKVNNPVEDVFESDIDFEEDTLLYDMTDNNTPVVDEVTIADAEEYFEDLGLEYNIDYKDNHYEKATGRRTTKKKKQEEIVEDEEANLEDNLFDLIDSKYEEGDEE